MIQKLESSFVNHLRIILLPNVDIAHLESLQEQLHIRPRKKEILNSMDIFAVVLDIGTASRKYDLFKRVIHALFTYQINKITATKVE